jgi:hypothetical protein
MTAPDQFGLQGAVAQSGTLPPVEHCGVSDFALLEKFRERRAKWISWYSFRKDDPNNIEGQIISMIFLDLSYRTLASGRGDFSKGPDIAARSGILAHMLDQGYVAIQVLAIRRLLDKRKDVFSLRRLFDDIRAKSEVITRENFVAYDGSPYDPNDWQQLPEDPMIQIWGIDAPGLQRFVRSSERNKIFDNLSGTDQANRNRKDTIKPDVFDKLLTWLDCQEARDLVKLSHKFFAHASDLDSREGVRYTGVLLKDIEAIQRAIISVERAITDDILCMGIARDVVAMEPLGFLKGLDQVYVPTETISEMDAHWEQLRKDRDSWRNAYEAELYK